jgi:hypothetical protein
MLVTNPNALRPDLPFVGQLLCEADVVFRDGHQGDGIYFESDQKDVQGTASRDEVIELASEWAASFYRDESLV